MNAIAQKRYNQFLLIAVFAVSFFAVRLPLLHEPLKFEEGIFANLIVNRPAGPFYSLGGRIDGENIYGYISHPAASYELLRLGGAVFQRFLGETVSLDDSLVTPRLRVISSLYQFLFVFFLLLYFHRHRDTYGHWPMLIIFAAALSPLAIKTSVYLQIDNTAGVILCGTGAFLFAISDKENSAFGRRVGLSLAGGFIVGLGKQEWSFALLLSLMLSLALLCIMKFELSRRQNIQLLCWVAVGLLAGNIASYLYDPINYTRAFHFIAAFSKLHDTSVGQWDFTHWLMLTKKRLPFVFVCFILLLGGISFLKTKQNRSLGRCLVLLYGFFLLLEYSLSDWNSELRYFGPSLAVLTVSAAFTMFGSLPCWYQRIFVTAVSSVFITTVVFVVGFSPDRNLQLEKINSGQIPSSPETILHLDSGAGWNKAHIDYVNDNTNYELTRDKYYEKFGRELVKP